MKAGNPATVGQTRVIRTRVMLSFVF